MVSLPPPFAQTMQIGFSVSVFPCQDLSISVSLYRAFSRPFLCLLSSFCLCLSMSPLFLGPTVECHLFISPKLVPLPFQERANIAAAIEHASSMYIYIYMYVCMCTNTCRKPEVMPLKHVHGHRKHMQTSNNDKQQ